MSTSAARESLKNPTSTTCLRWLVWFPKLQVAPMQPQHCCTTLLRIRKLPVGMIAQEFGKRVADIVMEVTDDKTLPKDERKRKQIETAPKKSREAKLINLADKTSNLRAVASSPAADWSVKRRLEYIEWAKNVVAGLRGMSPWLEQQFDEAVAAAQRSLNPPLAGA